MQLQAGRKSTPNNDKQFVAVTQTLSLPWVPYSCLLLWFWFLPHSPFLPAVVYQAVLATLRNRVIRYIAPGEAGRLAPGPDLQ